MTDLTEKQRHVLRFCHEFYNGNDQLPPLWRIAEEFAITANAARSHVDALLRKGHLERNCLGKLRFGREAIEAN